MANRHTKDTLPPTPCGAEYILLLMIVLAIKFKGYKHVQTKVFCFFSCLLLYVADFFLLCTVFILRFYPVKDEQT